MPTTTGDTTRVTIFDPIIKINGTDVGFISDKVTFTYKQKLTKYASGIPKSLRKALKTEEEAMVKFDLLQNSVGNFQSALNLPATSVLSDSIVKVGGDSQVNVLTNFQVIGTDDAGALLHITFHKAIIEDNGDFNIDSDYFKIPITVTAVADLTRTAKDQLFRIART